MVKSHASAQTKYSTMAPTPLNVKAVVSGPMDVEADLLCFMTTSESPQVKHVEASGLDGAVRQAAGDVAGQMGRIATIHNPQGNPPRIMVAGLGADNSITADTIRHVAGIVSKRARDIKVGRIAVYCPDIRDASDVATQIVEGHILSMYSFDDYKSKKASPAPELVVVCESDVADVVERARITAEGVAFTRSVANMPPNECPPAALADIAQKMAKERDMTCTVMYGSQLSEGGFGGITAVGQGSVNPPRLVILEYKGGQDDEAPVALVGKAVTFDTGGISIKPGERMDEMKFDKCGGCTVLGIMQAAADLRIPMNIVGVIPSVENMPGGGSYRPGDIIRLYGGKTAEILNTDAEGRLILSDALSYVEQRYSPRCIIDFATLTGACIIALGCDVAGMISNNDQLADAIQESARHTAEGVWRLPLDADYMEMVKSKVADIRNLGKGRAAGTIVAAAFLRHAINDTPWVHLDIAGTAWIQPPSKKRSYNTTGATGFGVRLILDYLRR